MYNESQQSIRTIYTVHKVDYSECKEWCLYKHYAHRMPAISYAFGLFDETLMLVGICTFGIPASPSLVKGVFGGWMKDSVYELNRLCVNEGLPQNVLSFFVSQCLKQLPKPMAVVSYADSGQNHHGYIYQATNWIYTGLSDAHKEYRIIGEENKHSRHQAERDGKKLTYLELQEALGDNIYATARARKHRYFYFLGTKSQVRKMKTELKYKTADYPKGDNVRYDASYSPGCQGRLF